MEQENAPDAAVAPGSSFNFFEAAPQEFEPEGTAYQGIREYLIKDVGLRELSAAASAEAYQDKLKRSMPDRHFCGWHDPVDAKRKKSKKKRARSKSSSSSDDEAAPAAAAAAGGNVQADDEKAEYHHPDDEVWTTEMEEHALRSARYSTVSLCGKVNAGYVKEIMSGENAQTMDTWILYARTMAGTCSGVLSV